MPGVLRSLRQRLGGWLGRQRFRPLPFRYERFGGIAQLSWPRALVFVDRERARALGYRR